MKMHSIHLASFPLLLLCLAGCGSEISDADAAQFVEHVREYIPSTATYDDEYLIGMAENVCRLGNEESALRILDNYRQLEPEDYHAFAVSALEHACPEDG